MTRIPRERAKSPKRDWPPVDLPLWRSIPLRRPLNRYRLETLLRLFDRRPHFPAETHPTGLDDVGQAILDHLLKEALLKIYALVPGKGDADEDLRSELKVAVLDHITSRKGPWSYRKHFVSSIYYEKQKILSNRAKEARRWGWQSLDASEDGGQDGAVADAVERVALEELEKMQRRRVLAVFLAGIADAEKRDAMVRLCKGETFKSIGLALGRDRATITRWVRDCFAMAAEAGGDGGRRRVGGGR